MNNQPCVALIDLDDATEETVTDGFTLYGPLTLFPLFIQEDPLEAQRKICKITEIMMIPAHPNIPRLVAEVNHMGAARYVALKNCGTPFSTVEGLISKQQLVVCMAQLENTIRHLHQFNFTHGNICRESLRVKLLPSPFILLVGLENASHITVGNWDKKVQKDFNDLKSLCDLFDIACDLEDLTPTVEIIRDSCNVRSSYISGTTTKWDTTDEDLSDRLDEIKSYTRGTYKTIPYDKTYSNEDLKRLRELSCHIQFVTIYRTNVLPSPIVYTMLMDYYPGALTLDKVIHSSGTYTFSDAVVWVDQTAQGVKFLSDQNLVHGAIQPEKFVIQFSISEFEEKPSLPSHIRHILYSNQYMHSSLLKTADRIKIIGLENVFKKTRDTRLYYLDPECFFSNEKSTNIASDVYSLGMVIHEIFSRRYACEMWEYSDWFDCSNLLLKMSSFLSTATVRAQDLLPRLAYVFKMHKMLRSMWHINPDDRVSIGNVVDYFRHIIVLPKQNFDLVCPKREDDMVFEAASKMLWPIYEFAPQAEQNIIHFVYKQVEDPLELMKWAPINRKAYPNKAIVSFPPATTVELRSLFTNRPLADGEKIRLTWLTSGHNIRPECSFTLTFVPKESLEMSKAEFDFGKLSENLVSVRVEDIDNMKVSKFFLSAKADDHLCVIFSAIRDVELVIAPAEEVHTEAVSITKTVQERVYSVTYKLRKNIDDWSYKFDMPIFTESEIHQSDARLYMDAFAQRNGLKESVTSKKFNTRCPTAACQLRANVP